MTADPYLDLDPGMAELDALVASATAYFSAQELTWLRRWHRCDLPPRDLWPNMLLLLQHVVHPLRVRWDAPLEVTSGWRPPKYNAEDKLAAKNSRHLKFAALDLRPYTRGRSAERERLQNFQRVVCLFVLDMPPEQRARVGLGLYNTRVHLDFGFRRRLTVWGSRRAMLIDTRGERER